MKMLCKSVIKTLITLGCIVALTGCAGAVVESARMNNDGLLRDKHMEAALADDSEAQYLVGKSYCCAPRNDAEGFYNNRKATEFLCQVARQNHAAAAFEIARIHSGDTIDGVRLLRRAATLMRGEGVDNRVIAYYWYSRAAQLNSAEAVEVLRKLEKQQISQFDSPLTTPCTIDEVYGKQ